MNYNIYYHEIAQNSNTTINFNQNLAWGIFKFKR